MTNAQSVPKTAEYPRDTTENMRVSAKETAATLLYALIFFIPSLMVTGYHVFLHNHNLQIPLVYLLNDRSLYPHDPFATALLYYGSFVWTFVAWCARIIPVKPLLFGLFLIERFLVIYAAGSLARSLAPRSRLAPVGAMAFFALAPTPFIGGGTLVEVYFEQTGLAIAFLMLAMASFYSSRKVAWAVWLALGFTSQSMYGAYAFTYFGAVFVLDPTYRKAWRSWLLPFGVFAAMAAPTVLLALYDFAGHAAADSALWVTVSRFRFAGHLYPLTWGKAKLAKFAVLMLLSLAFTGKYGGHRLDKVSRHSVIWAGVCVSWLVCAFAAAWLKSPSMLVMAPARATDVWCCFGMIGLISVLGARTEMNEENRGLLAAAFVASVLLWSWNSVPSFVIILGLITAAWGPAWDRVFRKGSSRRIVLILVLLIFVIGARGVRLRQAAHDTSIGPFFGRPDADVQEVGVWARSHTPKDAVFLVNPNVGFRLLLQRPVFIAWRDAAAILWYRSTVTEWAERMRALGLDVTQRNIDPDTAEDRLEALYAGLTDKDVADLKARYGIRYWVVSPQHRSGFHEVFRNKSYKVLAAP